MGYMVNFYKYKAYEKQMDKCDCAIKRRKIRKTMEKLLKELQREGVQEDELRRAI